MSRDYNGNKSVFYFEWVSREILLVFVLNAGKFVYTIFAGGKILSVRPFSICMTFFKCHFRIHRLKNNLNSAQRSEDRIFLYFVLCIESNNSPFFIMKSRSFIHIKRPHE